MTDAETITLRGTGGRLRARRHAWAAALPVLGDRRSRDVGLVVSELSATALRHGVGDEVLVRIVRDDEAVVVAIWPSPTRCPWCRPTTCRTTNPRAADCASCRTWWMR